MLEKNTEKSEEILSIRRPHLIVFYHFSNQCIYITLQLI